MKDRKAWVICSSVPDDWGAVRLMKAGEGGSELVLSNRSTGLPMEIPADGILQIVGQKKNQPEDVDLTPKVLARVVVPDRVRKALVILSPVDNHPNGWAFDVDVVDLADFKGGGWLFMNTSPLKVSVELGDETTEIPSGELKLFNDAIQAQSTKMAIRYLPRETEKQEWRILSASTVFIYPTRREICLFTWNKEHQRIDYHGITFTQM